MGKNLFLTFADNKFLHQNPKTLDFLILFGYNKLKQTDGGYADAYSERRIFE